MKKILIRVSIFFLLIFNLALIILPSSARYISKDFGYVWNVLFSKYTVFADDFIINQDTYNETTGEYESKELWGADTEIGNGNLQQWAPEFKIDKLNHVAFTVRNATSNDITLSQFTIKLYMFKNSDGTLQYTLTNTSSTKDYENIVGSVGFKKSGGTTALDGDSQFIVSVDNTSDYTIMTISIDPAEYYRRVLLQDNVLNVNNNDGTVNNEELINLEKYFVIKPGGTAEFNVSVLNNFGNGSTSHSVYSEIKMSARVFDRNTVNSGS